MTTRTNVELAKQLLVACDMSYFTLAGQMPGLTLRPWKDLGPNSPAEYKNERIYSSFPNFAPQPGYEVVYAIDRSDGSGGQFLYMPAGGSLNPSTTETIEKKMHYVHQQGQQVFKYAVKKMGEYSVRILQKNNIPFDQVDVFIAHQANLRIINATAERLKLSDDKVIRNINKYGNTTAATIPLAMQDALDEGKIKKGSTVLLAAVGAGYTVGSVVLRWAY